MYKKGFCLLIALCISAINTIVSCCPAMAALDNPYNIPASTGLNLATVVDYNTELPLNDVFKPARMFGSGDSITYLMNDALQGNYPGGTYVVTWQGTGDVTLGFDGNTIISKTTSGLIKTMEVNVTPTNNGIALSIRNSKAQDPVRNIHVFLPGTQNKGRFNQTFLNFIAPFSVLRFMDWGNTNNSTVQRWSQRAQVSDTTWNQGKGMPLEIMIELCNTTNKDGWFCVPHMADDSYVQNFATLLKQQLKPGLRAYIEYSNEVWNPIFTQFQFAQKQGRAQGLNSFQYYSQRACRVSDIARGILGTRAIPVMASQFVNPYISDIELGFNNASRRVGALAIAPYFGPIADSSNQGTLDSSSVSQINDMCLDDVRTSNLNFIRGQMQIARKYHLPLISYESGQGLIPVLGDTTMTDLFIQANLSTGMAATYQEYYHTWFQEGGLLTNHFADVGLYSQFGMWGMVQHYNQDTPKHQTIVKFANGTLH
jgi:hypothetical protein